MALDIHVLQSRTDTLTRESLRWGFPEDAHSAVFFGPSFIPSKFPLLCRMRDYYADAEFASAELPAVTDEISQLMATLPRERTIQQALMTLHGICDEAHAQGQMLLCFAD